LYGFSDNSLSIVNASAALSIRSGQNRAVCSIGGVNPNMAAGCGSLIRWLKYITTLPVEIYKIFRLAFFV